MTPESITAHLETARYGRTLDVRGETVSTNDDARIAAERGAPEGLVVVADRQTKGRGSRGRGWSSPPGEDLYFSIVLRPALPPAALPPVTLATGLAVASVVSSLVEARDVRVKWPNDVYLDGKKCAGILVESTTTGARLDAAIVGVGLNVNRARFEDALAPHATSLRVATDRTFDRAHVLGDLLGAIEREIDGLVTSGAASVTTRLGPLLLHVGERVHVDEVEGVLLGLSKTGAVRVATDDGVVRELFTGTLRGADAGRA